MQPISTRNLLSALTGLLFTFAMGCGLLDGGDRIDPDPNGDPNNGTTSSTTCSDNTDCRVDQECRNGGCEDHLNCANLDQQQGCPDGTLSVSINGDQGCFAECDQGVCPGEQTCDNGICVGDGASFAEGCTADWKTCSDGKEYRVSCSEGTCTCILNDVDTMSFETTTLCDAEAFHREVNEACGWLVPEL